MKFSICTTSYNSDEILEAHLCSIYSLFSPDEFEYVVVDNKSEDNTAAIYSKWKKKYGNITLISKRCVRGRGRQIAFEHSKTPVIVQVDCDMVYNKQWKEVIRWFLRNKPTFALVVMGGVVYPRKALEEIGGWQNLQQGEDLDVIFKLLAKRKVRFYPLIVFSSLRSFWRTKSKKRIINYYRVWRDAHDAFLLRRLLFWKSIRFSPLPKVLTFMGLSTAKIVAEIRRLYWDVIDIRDFSREDIQKNYIDLGIKGEKTKECFLGLGLEPGVPSEKVFRALTEKIIK